MTPEPNILDDLFHACSFTAYVTVARACGGWPDSEEVRKLAYSYYEQALVETNATVAVNAGRP